MHLRQLLQPLSSPTAISNLTPAIFASARCIHDIHAHTTRHPLHTLLRPIGAPLNHVSFLRPTSRRRRQICHFWIQPSLHVAPLLFLGLSCIIPVTISLGFGFSGLVFSVDLYPGSVHTVLLIFFFSLFHLHRSIHAAFLHLVGLSRSCITIVSLPYVHS
ncbi:hypothetical protein EDD17DRAFT_1108451 [Pisolithus thermaeus]|nr:hypothetical protein EV401DRAFT_281623 [Pisolithus croceorrhizus]KAI6167093.1 hypothetical protein EDD17DRAFT_1108451 [Pisolithus thermaeus]